MIEDLYHTALNGLRVKLIELSGDNDCTFDFAQEHPTVCNLNFISSLGHVQPFTQTELIDTVHNQVYIDSKLVRALTEGEVTRTKFEITHNTPEVSVTLSAS